MYVYEHKLVLNISSGPNSPEQTPFLHRRGRKGVVFTSLGEQTMGASPAHQLHTEYLRRGPSRSLANTWSLGLCVSAALLHELPRAWPVVDSPRRLRWNCLVPLHCPGCWRDTFDYR